MYSVRPGYVLGFHGCDQTIVDKVIKGSESLRFSTNDYDWIGNGIYFWDNSPSRALDFAKELQAKGSIDKPAVIGAIINLGYCLDLLDLDNLKLLEVAYTFLKRTREESMLPINKAPKHTNEKLIRKLDCAVIETLHELKKAEGKKTFDSVRSVFWEGDEVYPSAGFREKNHIQICVRNPNCIKGYFLPRDFDNEYPKV